METAKSQKNEKGCAVLGIVGGVFLFVSFILFGQWGWNYVPAMQFKPATFSLYLLDCLAIVFVGFCLSLIPRIVSRKITKENFLNNSEISGFALCILAMLPGIYLMCSTD
ncbi:MAG: hypothetical protein NTW79_02680 [Candidatus Berkelbacteria bacterium]|nr:hypothetical protein [Candidatus Berkelbacteria bacterium]